VYGGPSEPSPEPTYLDFAALQDSKTFAHYSHAALVKVAERGRRGIANNAVVNKLSRITPLLHRYLSNPWQGFAILVKRRRVSDHENLRVSRHSQIAQNAYPPRPICLDIQPLAHRRRCNARSPDYRLAWDSLASNHDTVCVDLIDAVSEANFDAQLIESLLRGFGKTLRKRPQDFGSHIDQHDSC